MYNQDNQAEEVWEIAGVKITPDKGDLRCQMKIISRKHLVGISTLYIHFVSIICADCFKPII